MKGRTSLLAIVAALIATLSGTVATAENAARQPYDLGKEAARTATQTKPTKPHRARPCVRGMAGEFPCKRVHLLAHLPLEEIGGSPEVGQGRGSDVWGWTDPRTKREYVLAGKENGTAIVDITRPTRPVYLAEVPTSSDALLIWRDIKVYRNHAYIVAESPGHGMQVVDLTRLRHIDRSDAPVTLEPDDIYEEFATAHNVFVNEDTGFAYAVGARDLADDDGNRPLDCSGGLHIMDVRDPANPAFAGCYEEDGYIHDVQCVKYHGPDRAFRRREICVAASPASRSVTPNSVTIVDVTDKANPVTLAVAPYDGSSFAHQGWLTEDHRFFLFGDEGDELDFGHTTKTYVWDVRKLADPGLIGTFLSDEPATDHNMYVKGRRLFQSNYAAGLRVLDLKKVAKGELREVGFFDVYPPDNESGFGRGTWSNYPFFRHGVVAVHGYQGLWIVRSPW